MESSSEAELAAASSGAEQSVASKKSLASEEQVKRGDRCEHRLLLDAPPRHTNTILTK
jgi:hypothetical protein